MVDHVTKEYLMIVLLNHVLIAKKNKFQNSFFFVFNLVNVKDQNGKSIFAGRKATGFSNAEEEEVKLTDAIPFLVETRLKELGANYEKNEKTWGVYVTVDGQRLFIEIFYFMYYFIFF